MANNSSESKGETMWAWDSLPAMQFLAHWGFIASVIAGAAAVVAGAVTTVASNRAASMVTRDADIRISEANARAEDAKRDAKVLELKIEQERSDRLELEQRVKPREISANQRAILLEELALSPKGAVNIFPDVTDAEARQFAHNIKSVLEGAGFSNAFKQRETGEISFDRLGTFLLVNKLDSPPPHARPILAAFEKAGLLFDIDEADDIDADLVFIGISSRA